MMSLSIGCPTAVAGMLITALGVGYLSALFYFDGDILTASANEVVFVVL